MPNSSLPAEQLQLVTPGAIRNYAKGIGWIPLAGGEPELALFHDPNSELKQLLVPLDPTFDDYPVSVARAIERLAEFEKREPEQILNHLLLPPADILRFREFSPEVEAGDISFEHGSRVIEGVRKILLACAHSVIQPQTYHPRLSRDEARQFLSRCRMTTSKGSFILNVSCVHDQSISLPGIDSETFTRSVTRTLIESLDLLLRTSQTQDASTIVDSAAGKHISANLCEALLLIRPQGDRSKTEVRAEWSRSLFPAPKLRQTTLELRQEVFELAESLAPRLRSFPQPQANQFFGFVDELRGTPALADQRISGEVRVTLMGLEEELHAKMDLNPEQYAIAGQAHLNHKPIMVSGILHRLPRLNRIEQITQFGFIPMGN